jgi:hypothetical protein
MSLPSLEKWTVVVTKLKRDFVGGVFGNCGFERVKECALEIYR